MYYRRFRFLTPLLVIGAFVGFGSAFHHAWHAHHEHREDFERHIADVCADAALRAAAKPGAGATPAAPR
jgi:hypothetical protein